MGPMGKALGMGKRPMPSDDEEEYSEPVDNAEEESEEGGDVPPDFEALYADYEEAPSAKALYDLIKSCEGGGESEKPGGLALILGGKKGK